MKMTIALVVVAVANAVAFYFFWDELSFILRGMFLTAVQVVGF